MIAKSRNRRKSEAAPPVSVDALKAGLPAFWPIRDSIGGLPSNMAPQMVFVSRIAREMDLTGGDMMLPELLDMEAALEAIQKVRPDDGGAVFCRLWWLAIWLDGSPLGWASDHLVSAGQTSDAWEAVLRVAAGIKAKANELEIAAERFEAALKADLAERRHEKVGP